MFWQKHLQFPKAYSIVHIKYEFRNLYFFSTNKESKILLKELLVTKMKKWKWIARVLSFPVTVKDVIQATSFDS